MPGRRKGHKPLRRRSEQIDLMPSLVEGIVVFGDVGWDQGAGDAPADHWVELRASSTKARR